MLVQGFGRRPEAEGLAGPGVECRGDRVEVVDVHPGALVADELGLEQRVERLSQGVVV